MGVKCRELGKREIAGAARAGEDKRCKGKIEIVRVEYKSRA